MQQEQLKPPYDHPIDIIKSPRGKARTSISSVTTTSTVSASGSAHSGGGTCGPGACFQSTCVPDICKAEETSEFSTQKSTFNTDQEGIIVLDPLCRQKVIEVPREEIQERVIEVPKIQYVEKYVEVPKPVTVTKEVRVPKPVYQERYHYVKKQYVEEQQVEVPKIEYVNKYVEVPEIVYLGEKVREMPVVMVVERICPVLKTIRRERVIEIPDVHAHVISENFGSPTTNTGLPSRTIHFSDGKHYDVNLSHVNAHRGSH